MKKFERIKKRTHELILSTTIHGLPNIIKENTFIRRIIWFFLFITFSSFGIYMILINIFDYLEYDFITKIVLINESPSQFPTVTFYNLKHLKSNYSLEDILIDCKFNDINCSSDNFEKLKDDFGNNYYQFNNGKSLSKNQSVEKIFKPGKKYGLRVKIFVGLQNDNDVSTKEIEVINYYSPSDGFHILVHNHSNDPQYSSGFPYDGIDISVGFETSIIVDRIFNYNLPKPYNNCYKNLTQIDAFDSDLYRFIINSTDYAYRQKDCFEYCLTQHVIKNCNLTQKITNISKFDSLYLKLYAKNESFCIGKFYNEFIIKDIDEQCDDYCPLECDSINYHLSTSFAKFPNKIYANELLNNSKIISKFPNGYNITYNDLLNTMIAFNVYYNELSYTKITQLPKTQIMYLIAAIGGLLGLSIGVSCMSFAEIFQLIFEYFLILFERNQE